MISHMCIEGKKSLIPIATLYKAQYSLEGKGLANAKPSQGTLPNIKLPHFISQYVVEVVLA